MMKSLFIAVLLLAAGLPCRGQHSADFNHFRPGPIRDQGRWLLSYGSDAFAEIVAGHDEAGNAVNVARLSSDSEGGVRLIFPLKEPVSGNRQVSYQLRMKASVKGSSTAFAAHLDYNNGKPKFVVAFSRSGALAVFDGESRLPSEVSLAAGEWYQVDTILAEDGESVTLRLWRVSDRALLFIRENLGFSEGQRDVATGYHDIRLLTTADSGEWEVRRVMVVPPEEL